MWRNVYTKLVEWKNSKDRKPLILNGARQVGKTWLLKEFGNNEYKNIAYINCDESTEMQDAFSDLDTKRLIRFFSALTNTSITPGETLIILDEIQQVPLGITALKYFYENSPEYHIAVAGSLLGVTAHSGTGFPVGKVNEINLYPLSFEEFLLANGEKILVEQIGEHRWEELSVLSQTFIELLRQYYYVGGMPEAVESYVNDKDFLKVREVQKQILADYRRDFSKHIPKDIIQKANMVWDSIPAQLAKENKKFIYSTIRKGARAREFENAIGWLTDAGLVHKIQRVSKLESPLKFYEEYNSFKLFMVDLGLLGAMTGVSAKDVIVDNNAFVEYKGAFTEQFVLQELKSLELNVYYYSQENSTLEIDFAVQKRYAYPMEVKASENLRSKSLKNVYEKNNKLKPVRVSMSDYRRQDWMVNVPLYLMYEWIKAAE